MHRALQHRLLSSSRTVHRPCSRIISGRRHPTRARTFHRSSKHCLPKEPQDGTDPVESGGNQAASDEDAHSSTPIAGNGQSETVAANTPPKVLTYYGSAARRQLRRSSVKEPEQATPVPEWFLEYNTRLHSELKSAAASPLQLAYPQSQKALFLGLSDQEKEIAELVPGDEGEWDISKDDGGPNGGMYGVDAARDPIPLPGKRYFVDFFTFTELLFTAAGLLKLPRPEFAGEVAAEKSHLILHYPAEGGSFLLDEVVERLSQRMRCDLLVLDAQDISELVARSDNLDSPPEELMQASRLLSYEVYNNNKAQYSSIYDHVGEQEEHEEDAFEFESQGDSNKPRRSPERRAMIIAKSMSLSDLFGSTMTGNGAKGRSRNPRSFLGGMQGEGSHRSKSPKHILAPLVDALVSSPQLRKQRNSATNLLPEVPDIAVDGAAIPPAASPDSSMGLVIHIKDLRSIQDTHFGGQFLSALYENVQSRRLSGQPIVMVGTETSHDEATSYSKTRIQDMQRGELDEMSRNIFLTPVTPNTDAKLALSEDRRRRTRIINMRHLIEQYRQKNPKALEGLPKGFWQIDPKEYFGTANWSSLENSNLSFGEIHRLSSYLAGRGRYDPFIPDGIQRSLLHLKISDKVKFDWAEHGRGKSRPVSDDKTSILRKTASKHEKRLLGGVMEPAKIKTSFNDVHAPIETIDALKTLTTLSLIRPEAFLYGVLATDKIPGLLLYGPPGTGKTLLAKAVAKESGAAMLEVSAAEINDLYVGEGEKNVKAVFSLAKKLSPCVIFIDEADALFSARTSGHQRVSHRELLNQFLKEWDGMSNDSSGAFIMVATNRPGDLDEAVLRRLPRRLLVDLPSENDRLEILKIHLREEQLAEDVNLSDLAARTPFYSGSDLKNLGVAAALSCVREENDLATAHTGEQPYQHAEKRTLTMEHFSKALEEITASISEDMNSLKEIKKFDEQYGDKRGKKKALKWGFETASEAGKVLDTVKVRT